MLRVKEFLLVCVAGVFVRWEIMLGLDEEDCQYGFESDVAISGSSSHTSQARDTAKIFT